MRRGHHEAVPVANTATSMPVATPTLRRSGQRRARTPIVRFLATNRNSQFDGVQDIVDTCRKH